MCKASCKKTLEYPVQERVAFPPHPKTLTMAGDYEYFAAQVSSLPCPFHNTTHHIVTGSLQISTRKQCWHSWHILHRALCSAGKGTISLCTRRAHRQLLEGHIQRKNSRQEDCDIFCPQQREQSKQWTGQCVGQWVRHD